MEQNTSDIQSAEPQLTSTAQDTVQTQNVKAEAPAIDPKIKKRNDDFRTRIDVCKLYRRKLIANWAVNIDYRRGKPFTSQSDEDQIAVNLDWSLTKAKQAALFSQIPQVRINHNEDILPNTAPWAGPFQKKLNETLVTAGIESAMDECLPDCINAAGIGVIMVSYQSITEDKQIPLQDPSTLQPGQEPEMTTVPQMVDKRYITERISPADLLWPINFIGSNFDNGAWLGRSGRIAWAEAKQQFNLDDKDKDAVLGEDRPQMDRLTHDVERDKVAADDMVGFDEIFYKEYQFDDSARSYSTIHRLVYIAGKTDPVVDEPWKGQRIDEQSGQVVGAQKFPIRVLTLTYITDETIPPSDSAVVRPQVNEINKGRGQMIRQRERSIPIRTIDVNRVDPAIAQSLMRGTWQNMIPVQGDGERIIREVSRAQMAPENFTFDKIAKADLQEIGGMGPNQMGTGAGVETKGESESIQQGVNGRITRDRARVASFVCGVAEVLGGLLCLYEDPQQFGQGFNPAISLTFKYSILADSTVLLDANQKIKRLSDFISEFAKSGWVNIEPVLQEIATLSGLDPNVVIKPPQPKPPVEPNISIRLTGVEDLLNPLSLALLMKSGQAPSADLIEQAKQLIQKTVEIPQGMQMSNQPLPPGGFPMLPASGPNPAGPASPGPNGAPPIPPPPTPQPPKIGDAHPQWTSMPTLNKRTESGQ